MKRWVLVLVIGFGFLGVCLLWATEDSSAIKCDGRIMSYGDVCETTKGGRTVRTETYDQMKAGAEVRERAFKNHGGWVGGVGVALTGLGATMLIRGQRRASRAGVTAPRGGQPQWQARQRWQGQPQPEFPLWQGNPPYVNQAVQQYPPPRPGPPAQAVQQPYPPQGAWPQQHPPRQQPPQQFGPTGH
ncbi:hypothetical protein BS329_10795 [Amycolatopsis coloradensis]|uniref:Uncharacterized protein n=1 Tax=Amycolatopsis coloradensis TaxID=76021 RepID=A0A1R0KW89_9PSEU|nr:hypothetical protein [Amycolatopsis coloradensis]OLZ53291.1 hypothetical protein BS329_10795 [Amycolatopsis coloradensis]